MQVAIGISKMELMKVDSAIGILLRVVDEIKAMDRARVIKEV